MRFLFKPTRTCSFTTILHSIAIVSLCGIIGCKHYEVDYLSQKDIQNSTFDKYKSKVHTPSNYGALRFNTNNNPYDEGRVLMLNRQGSHYYTETLVHKSKDRRYFLSVGADSDEKAPMFGFRVEF